MFTANYGAKAAHLASSCVRLSLPYELHEVPTVHWSMSAQGSDDLRFTKANLIHHLMRKHGKAVLYIDANCEIISYPHLIAELVQARYDFAIYNWLADGYSDRFKPTQIGADDLPTAP